MNILEKTLALFTTAVFNACNPKMHRDDGRPVKDEKPKIIINPFTNIAHTIK